MYVCMWKWCFTLPVSLKITSVSQKYKSVKHVLQIIDGRINA